MRHPLLVAACLLLSTTAAAQTWSFETADDLPTGENIWYEPGDAIVIDSTEATEGVASARIDCAEGYCGLWYEIRDIDQYRGRAVTLSVDARTAYTDEEEQPFYIYLVARKGDTRLKQADNWLSGPRGVTSWATYSVSVPVPEDTEFLAVSIESGGVGSSWVDHARLTPREWTKLDSMGAFLSMVWGTISFGSWGLLKAILALLVPIAILIGFASRSRKRERLEISWSLRWLGVSLFITVLPVGVYYFGSDFPVNLREFVPFLPYGVLLTLSGILGLIVTRLWRRFRNRIDEVQLWRNLVVAIRFFLILIFFSYGMAKIFRTQFAPIPEFQLDSTLGELTSMRLLWLYFGHSYAYVLFVAASQIVAAILLGFQRTYRLGALILVAVVTNIVYVNFAYAIWVKWQSGVFLAMAIFLCLDEVPRLWQALIMRRSTIPESTPSRPALPRPWGHVLSTAVVIGFGVWMGFRSHTSAAGAADRTNLLPFHGVWRVEARQPASDSAAANWQRLAVSTSIGNGAGVHTSRLDEAYARLDSASFDASLQTFVMIWDDTTDAFRGTYQMNADTLILSGQQFGDSTRVRLLRKRYQLEPDL